MDHLISARWPDLEIASKKKRTSRIVDFAIPADHRVKLKKNNEIYLDLVRELKKTMENESDGDTNSNWHAWYRHQRIGTGTGRFGKEDEWKPSKWQHCFDWPAY